MIAGDRALQPGCDAEPRFDKVRYLVGGLQPTLAVRRLSSATTPGVERDALSMRARECAGISSAEHCSHMVNGHDREGVCTLRVRHLRARLTERGSPCRRRPARCAGAAPALAPRS